MMVSSSVMVVPLCFSANGNLYGVFGVMNASVSVSGGSGQVARILSYTVVRISGEAVDTNITIQHIYNQASYYVNARSCNDSDCGRLFQNYIAFLNGRSPMLKYQSSYLAQTHIG